MANYAVGPMVLAGRLRVHKSSPVYLTQLNACVFASALRCPAVTRSSISSLCDVCTLKRAPDGSPIYRVRGTVADTMSTYSFLYFLLSSYSFLFSLPSSYSFLFSLPSSSSFLFSLPSSSSFIFSFPSSYSFLFSLPSSYSLTHSLTH